MLIEFALHALPALRPSIEVNANPVWKGFVDCPGGSVCYGLGHIVGFHNGCVRTTYVFDLFHPIAAAHPLDAG